MPEFLPGSNRVFVADDAAEIAAHEPLNHHSTDADAVIEEVLGAVSGDEV